MLISTYVCHPSLANDNLSGIAVATMLAKRLLERDLRHTYRFVFGPGTIGPLAWLHQNRDRLDRVQHGLTLSCIGDAGDLTYKRSRRGDAEVDRAMEIVLRDSGAPHRLLPWEPWGGDERQFCSPGFDLPVGTLMRTPHGEFAGYHTSADGLDRIRPESLAGAVDTGLELVDVLETNRRCTNLSPYGEPQLGRRGLYRSAGGAVETPTTNARCCGCSTRATGPRRCSISPRARACRTRSCGAPRSGSKTPVCSPERLPGGGVHVGLDLARREVAVVDPDSSSSLPLNHSPMPDCRRSAAAAGRGDGADGRLGGDERAVHVEPDG